MLEGGSMTTEELISAFAASTTSEQEECGAVGTFLHLHPKGFGFISPDDGRDDVFVHVSVNPKLKRCQGGEKGDLRL